MARGAALSFTIARREEQTSELFVQLDSLVGEAERKQMTHEIVRINLPLADALAGRYVGRGAEYEDLVQVARTALLLAVRRFRSTVGAASFGAFAVPTITGELKRHFRDHCWVVRPPRQVQELRWRVVRVREEAEQTNGSTVAWREVASRLNVTEDQVRECIAVTGSYRPLSFDADPADRDRLGIDAHVAYGEDAVDELAERIDLRRALATLSPQERQVLRWRFQDECTQSEIARRLGVSQMQVSRIIRRLLARTRDLLQQPGEMSA